MGQLRESDMSNTTEAVKIKIASAEAGPEVADAIDSVVRLRLVNDDGVEAIFDLEAPAIAILLMTLQPAAKLVVERMKVQHPEKFNRPDPFEGL